MASDPVFCALCEKTTRLVENDGNFNPSLVVPGQIRFLPDNIKIPAESCCWELNQHGLNEGVFTHPCIITRQSACGHLVHCLPCTSFGGRSLKERHDAAYHKVRDYYMGLTPAKSDATHGDVAPTDGCGILTFIGPPMAKPRTYVGCGEGFWIEPQYLTNFCQKARCLDPKSLSRLCEAISRWAGRPFPLADKCVTPRRPATASAPPSPFSSPRKAPCPWSRSPSPSKTSDGMSARLGRDCDRSWRLDFSSSSSSSLLHLPAAGSRTHWRTKSAPAAFCFDSWRRKESVST